MLCIKVAEQNSVQIMYTHLDAHSRWDLEQTQSHEISLNNAQIRTHACRHTRTQTGTYRNIKVNKEEHRLARACAHTHRHTHTQYTKTNSGMSRHFSPDIITFIC